MSTSPCLRPFLSLGLLVFLSAAPVLAADAAEEPAEPARAETPPAEDRAQGDRAPAPEETTPEQPSVDAQGIDWSLGGIMRRGGPLMWPILLCSIAVVALTIERALSLRRDRHLSVRLPDRVLAQLRADGPDAALKTATDGDNSLGRLLAAALRRFGASRQEMAQGVLDESARLQYDLRRYTRVLGIIGSVSPLLGLLGTVLGMIRAFHEVQFEGLGRGEFLAGGISEALLTTGAGLAVAIPSYLLYQFFKARGDDLVREAEEMAEHFVIACQRPAEAIPAPAEPETGAAPGTPEPAGGEA